MTAQQPTPNAPTSWQLNDNLALPLHKPAILAILNTTPDSFSTTARHLDPQHAAEHAAAMIEHGADAIDVGGESTRPGAKRVPPNEQIRRVIPAIRAIRDAGISAPISIDTTRAEVAAAAIDAGANAINDVSAATEDPEILRLAERAGTGIILMHRRLPPDADVYSNQYETDPDYTDHPAVQLWIRCGNIVDKTTPVRIAVRASLADAAQRAVDIGIHPARIVLDPGLGFGKSVDQNLALIHAMSTTGPLGLRDITPHHTPQSHHLPLLAAASRKSFLAPPAPPRPPTPPSDRLPASIAVAANLAAAGVRLFRVHDVRETRQALDIIHKISENKDL